MTRRGEYFYALDVVRFLAALMVVFFHLGWSTWSFPTSLGASLVGGLYRIPEMEPFAWWGAIGVQIFFVISGFVIANSANGQTPFRFLRSRIERLYPAVWIIAPITALVWFASGAMANGEIIERLARSLALFPMGPWIDGVYWTLPCEIFFYFLIFILLCAGGFSRLEIFAVALAAVSGAFNVVYLLDAFTTLDFGWVHLFAEGSLKPLLPYYGVLFALGLFAWLDRQKLLSGRGKLVAAITSAFCLAQVAEWGVQHGGGGWLVPVIVWSISILVVRYSRWSPTGTLAGAVRSLGLITYPLYLIHFTIGCYLMRQLVVIGKLNPLAALFCTVITLIVACWLIITFLEPRLRENLRSLLVPFEAWSSKIPAFSFLNRRGGSILVQTSDATHPLKPGSYVQ